MPREIRVYDYLDKLGIEYYRVDHEASQTMERCLEKGRLLGTRICKNLFLCNRQKSKYYMLMMPADKPFKTHEVSSQINSSRLQFGSPEKMLEYLDVIPGSVSLMALMNDTENHVQLLVDEELFEKDNIGCHPCVSTSSLKIKTTDAFGTYLESTGHSMIKVRLSNEPEE